MLIVLRQTQSCSVYTAPCFGEDGGGDHLYREQSLAMGPGGPGGPGGPPGPPGWGPPGPGPAPFFCGFCDVIGSWYVTLHSIFGPLFLPKSFISGGFFLDFNDLYFLRPPFRLFCHF